MITSAGTTMTTTATILCFSEILRLFNAFFFDRAATNSLSYLGFLLPKGYAVRHHHGTLISSFLDIYYQAWPDFIPLLRLIVLAAGPVNSQSPKLSNQTGLKNRSLQLPRKK
jgi:hypothetical protein